MSKKKKLGLKTMKCACGELVEVGEDCVSVICSHCTMIGLKNQEDENKPDRVTS